MRWKSGRRSEHVEDRPGYSAHSGGGGGHSGSVERSVGISVGIGGVVLVIVMLLLGVDPSALLTDTGQGLPSAPSTDHNRQPTAVEAELLVNAALNLPLLHARLNRLSPETFSIHWQRPWNLIPMRVGFSSVAADGLTPTERWQFDAAQVAASISLLPRQGKPNPRLPGVPSWRVRWT